MPRAPHSTSNPCGILAQHWTRSAFCVGSAFALCVLPAPSTTDRPSSQRPSVFHSTRPDIFCCAPAPRSSHQTHPSLGFFWLAVNRVEPGQETSIGANCHSLTSRRVVSLVLGSWPPVCRVSHRRARLFRTCSPLPELTTHRTHASPNRLEVRRHPSHSSTLLAVRPVLRHSDLRGPLREKS